MELAPQNDAVLLPYLRATGETEAGSALEQVVCERAQPLIRDIIRSKLRVGHSSSSDITDDEATEMVSDVTLKLLGRLVELKSNTADKAINNFRGYVAVMSYHACDQYLRKKYPRRYSLKNQLRYILTHRDGLALWESDERPLLCGFAEWKDSKQVRRQARLSELLDKPKLFANSINAKLSLPNLLATIFNRNGGPLELDDLVSLVADLWQIKDGPSAPISIDSDTVDAYSGRPQLHEQLDARMDQRSQLERLWAEIRELPLRQRVALLLSLRDANGRGVLTLLPLVRIASIRQIAETLAMPAEKLAALWNQLPVEDAIIAASLGVTRQQVINLRKSARQRLLRRIRDFG
ncbi:MAG: hypothetical protein ABJC05_07435 [Pyrinomonadaceae bacterium]